MLQIQNILLPKDIHTVIQNKFKKMVIGVGSALFCAKCTYYWFSVNPSVRTKVIIEIKVVVVNK